MLRRALAGAVCIFISTSRLTAQEGDSPAARAQAAGEATRLANAGRVYAARQILDSLARATPSEAPDYAEILFARATLAPSVLDAALDYERIASNFAGSGSRKASLLRLAQRTLLSGDARKSLEYLQRILSDYPDDTSVAEAQYWRARALFDTHDIAAACAAIHEATTHAQAARSSLLPEIEGQGSGSCGQAPPIQLAAKPAGTAGTALPKTALPPTEPMTASAKQYAVQVSAFALQRDAEEMAARLKRRGLDAHVDGSSKPFRVKVGRYPTYAEAAKALRDLKAKGIAGFVTETSQ